MSSTQRTNLNQPGRGVTLLPAVEQLDMLRRGQISPIELADEHVRQIERLNPDLNAIVDFDPARVRAQAARNVSGTLAGLPVTVKSSIAVAGYRCETGSILNRGHIPREDAVVVARLRAAGATILGTTNCPEFLMAYETRNDLYGTTENPWMQGYTAGGSSGGEAAAIAAGLSAGGLGSDSGGSVREPAHFSGICALKPTPGRLPGTGHLPACVGPFAILGAIGPMARTIADVDLLFRTLSGQDPNDPVSPPIALRTIESARDLTIGFFEDDGLTSVTAETRQAVRDAAQSLQRQGFTVKPFRPRSLELARKLWWTFFMQCGEMFYASTIQGREGKLSHTFRDYLAQARSAPPLTAQQLLNAWAECDLVRAKLLEEMREFPILLCPTCAVPAFPHGEREFTVDGSTIGYLDAMRYTQWFNLLAAPAAVVPVGRSPLGLPIGVQIAGRPFADEEVLAVAACLEEDYGYIPPPISLSEWQNADAKPA
jgi:amidase